MSDTRPSRQNGRHCCNVGCEVKGTKETRVLRCSRCKACFYCSRKCQAAHWPRHKILCNCASRVAVDDGGISLDRLMSRAARLCSATCNNSGCPVRDSRATPLELCSRCNSALYCSHECQLADWPRHRANCKLVRQINQSGTDKFDYDRIREFEIAFQSPIWVAAARMLQPDESEVWLGDSQFARYHLVDLAASFKKPRLEVGDVTLEPLMKLNDEWCKSTVEGYPSGVRVVRYALDYGDSILYSAIPVLAEEVSHITATLASSVLAEEAKHFAMYLINATVHSESKVGSAEDS